MTVKRIFILLAFLLASIVGSTQQDKKVIKADNNFNQRSYVNAIESYEKLVTAGYTSEEIYKRLGDAQYLNANYNEAANWYGKLSELDGANMDSEYMYRYSQALKSSKKYAESDQ